MKSFFRRLGLSEVTCGKCGFKTISSDDEISHIIKHALEELVCKPQTKQIIELIDHEFLLENIEESEDLINQILKIMNEDTTKRFKIINHFLLTTKTRKC